MMKLASYSSYIQLGSFTAGLFSQNKFLELNFYTKNHINFDFLRCYYMALQKVSNTQQQFILPPQAYFCFPTLFNQQQNYDSFKSLSLWSSKTKKNAHIWMYMRHWVWSLALLKKKKKSPPVSKYKWSIKLILIQLLIKT